MHERPCRLQICLHIKKTELLKDDRRHRLLLRDVTTKMNGHAVLHKSDVTDTFRNHIDLCQKENNTFRTAPRNPLRRAGSPGTIQTTFVHATKK